MKIIKQKKTTWMEKTNCTWNRKWCIFFSISIQVPIFLITANNKRRFFLQNQTTKNWADVILESCCPWWSIFPTKFWGREFRKTTRSCLSGLVWPLISILSPNIVEKVLYELISALIDVYIYIYIYMYI
jgi:hypothetical protein